jgi:ATPase subunit of ABC transporter with duplicated ATPase domains
MGEAKMKSHEIICLNCFKKFEPKKVLFVSDEEYAKGNNFSGGITARDAKNKKFIETTDSYSGVVTELYRYANGKEERLNKRICPYCKMELYRNAGLRKIHIISIIGANRVGKTTYLYMLMKNIGRGALARFQAFSSFLDENTFEITKKLIHEEDINVA